jgi:FkbM family methyltransferase
LALSAAFTARWRRRITAVRALTAFSNPIELTFIKVFTRQPVVTYRYGPYNLMSLESCGDGDSIRECLSAKAYDPAIRAVQRSGSGRTYMNLGANVGAFDVAIHALWGSGTRGVAVEMNPWTCARLVSNLRLNRLPTEAIHAAVAGRSGTAALDVTRSGPAQSLYQSPGPVDARVTVPVRSLSDLQGPSGDEPIDLLKVDCEGAEYEIFREATPSDLARFRFMVIEIHDRPGPPATLIDEICAKGGYTARELRRETDARLVLFGPRGVAAQPMD